MVKIGIIGGSGLDNPNILEDPIDKEATTPYGSPSSKLKIGKIKGKDVVILSRHGREHQIPPSQINYRANIYALKQEGCTHIIATTACGSLKREIERGDLIFPDQFIDFTRHRQITFYDEFPNEPKHTQMSQPFNKNLRNKLIEASKNLNLKHHESAIVITIEGPRFSTKAESKMFSNWGADIINMSIAPEAILANEIGLPYATIAMSTDYDCLFDDIQDVTWEEVLKVFNENVEKVTNLLIETIENLTEKTKSEKIKEKIRTVPNFPQQGIMFRDITTLLQDPEGLSLIVKEFKNRYQDKEIDVVAGIESRGFILASILAHELQTGFIPIRKKGKLPSNTISQEYELEYGSDQVEIHSDSIKPGQKVLLVDDLIATGGSMSASAQLIERLGGEIIECCAVIDLPDLNGSRTLAQKYPVFRLVEFEGE